MMQKTSMQSGVYPDPGVRKNCEGLTMVEMIISTGILSLVFLGIGAMMSGSASNTKILRSESALISKAQEILDVCRVIPFGTDDDPCLVLSELQELFDGDPQMGTSSVTLHALRKTAGSTANQGTITLSTSNQSYFPDGFPVQGKFKIKIARAGSALLTRAITKSPMVYQKLKNGTLVNDQAMETTVLFEDARDRRDRVLLVTTITAQNSEGASE